MYHYTLNAEHSRHFRREKVHGDVIESSRPWCFVRHSPREKVRDDVIETCRPWCAGGWHDLGAKSLHEAFRNWRGRMSLPCWRLRSTPGERGSLLFTLHRSEEPIVTCGVAPDETAADEVWSVIEGIYLELTDRAPHRVVDWEPIRKPGSTPWLAVVLVAPSHVYVNETWIGDFERCIAWAWMDERA